MASPGAALTIRGSGFNPTTTATVGGKSAAASFIDASTLSVTVPVLNSGPASIVLTNEDGTSYIANGLLKIQ